VSTETLINILGDILMQEFLLMGISDAIDIVLIIVTVAMLITSSLVWGIHFFVEWEKRQNK
jgi:hypothetical protein